MDIRGILGIDSDVRNGFDGIKVTYKIDADASPDDIKATRRAVAEALGRLRHHHQPDQRHGRGEVVAASRRRDAASVRTTTVVIGAAMPGSP